MKQDYFISLYLDTRRELASKKYPVKLRVYTPQPRRQKLYPTKFKMTEKEFQSTYKTEKPRNEHKETRRKMQAAGTGTVEVAERIRPLKNGAFGNKMKRKQGDSGKIA